ncbi:hypothetical protein CEXT_756861 [Caerostris extrusa]|uniref:Uncharacterized protein n=1 Tax=Caerostris extrusa TaxID=172846 RepID=A0AAV4XC75_CAEEX|nr:hypothetical protein CEXT_756861 [Caerostris extrusa]
MIQDILYQNKEITLMTKQGHLNYTKLLGQTDTICNAIPDSHSFSTGAIIGRRCPPRVQAPEAEGPQMDHPPLLPLQSGLGLDYPTARHLHSDLHALRSGLPVERGADGQ